MFDGGEFRRTNTVLEAAFETGPRPAVNPDSNRVFILRRPDFGARHREVVQ